MKLIIGYKNNMEDVFQEQDLDCSKLTLRGHAANAIAEWSKSSKAVHVLDHYNAILLDEVASIRVKQ